MKRQYLHSITKAHILININGEASFTNWNRKPPNGYPIKTPAAIPPRMNPINLDLSSSLSSYILATIPMPHTAMQDDATP